MVSAYVLITTSNLETKNVLMKLRSLDMVQTAEALTGPYDIIALVKANDMDTLGERITQEIQHINGIERTMSSIVLKL